MWLPFLRVASLNGAEPARSERVSRATTGEKPDTSRLRTEEQRDNAEPLSVCQCVNPTGARDGQRAQFC
ncbi:hypothetical protein AAFF_G00321700 [Aldrovandia affinis]|uniref:Uncharacterized protein n=1 Tax=Aldrovandia affinis TaxID=143900 RepID=A0AAD7WR08_9TELE|nr:hypothetical protein AAFF_G00321700 [Aldrovandia affinis]